MIKLFISYRRSDSQHAAQRVRMSLQEAFGDDAVFIDREIPAGTNWEQHLEQMLVDCTGVVVMVGDEFLRLLRKHRDGTADLPDPLVWEIATALRLGKTIYPVLFGRIDMPDPAKLPESIRAMARYQAVFAREPAFDAAIGELIKAVAATHGALEQRKPPRRADAGSAAPDPALVPPLQALLPPLLLAAAAVLLLWWSGRLVLWLADPASAAGRPAESALWHGLRYGLSTLLWGLGPYLAYWMVAQLRARARLPIFNLHGVLMVGNVAGILVSGGSFLLLSTLPGWHLQPLWLFPAMPGPLHYALLALGLLVIVVVDVGMAVWEPQVRALAGEQRTWGLRAINAISATVGVCGLWFAASIAHSLPDLGALDPVPVVGYLMLCPSLSLLAVGWAYGQSLSGLSDRPWQIRTLMGLVIALVLACTLALFAYGPTRLLAPGL